MSDSSSKRLPLILAGATAAVAAAVLTAIALRRQWALDEPAPDVPDATSTASPVVGAATSTASAASSASTPPAEPVSAEASAAATERQEQARRAKERGNKRFQGKQYPQAIAEYTSAIELADETDPDVAKFYGNRAQCHAHLQQHAEAEADCDAALRIDPRYIKALVRRAMAREKLGKSDVALIDFTGALLLSDMKHEIAATGIDRLIKLIAAEKAAKRLQEPMHCLPSAFFIATFIDSFRAHRERLSLPRPTVDELSQSLASTSSKGVERAKLLAQRALAHMKACSYEMAMLDWAAAVSLISPLGEGFGAGGDATLSEAERESTLQAWNKAAEAPVSPGLAIGMLGMFFHLRHNYDKAMACYDRALELDKCVEVLLKRSSLWFEKEELSKAFGDFDTAIALDPKHPDIYCHRGQLHMLQQDLQKAVDDLKKSVRLDGGSVLARIQLGMAHHRLKQTTDARTVFQETEARFPTSPDALNYHGEFLIDSGDFEGAKAKFEKAIEVSNGGFALAHVNLGVIKLHAENDSARAIEFCKQAIAADPLCETAHIHLAHLMLQISDLGAAVVSFDDAVALIRVKQELEETFAMREASAAQLTLLNEQPEIFKPVIEKQQRDMKERLAQYQASQT